MSRLDKQAIVAGPGYSRWLIPPAALAVHLSIGQVYAFSVFKNSLVADFDTSLTAIGWVFSLAIVMLGLSAAVLGTWVERSGPRKAMLAAAALLGHGLPRRRGRHRDRPAVAAVPRLRRHRRHRPRHRLHLTGLDAHQVVPRPAGTGDRPGDHGLRRRRAHRRATLQPVDGAFDPGFVPTEPGAVASGSALSQTFITLGVVYTVFMLIGAALIRVPPGHGDDQTAEHSPGTNGALVRASKAIRTPQFWLLWVVLFCNVTAGIGILEQAAPMIQDFFRVDGVSSISAAAAAGFVGVLSLANMIGRFVWSSLSDRIGRRGTYVMYLGVGLVLYLLLALFGSSSTFVFVALAAVIISYYGGGFATVPAYLKDLFGTLEVGAIHGRLLTAWAAAGVAGPLIVNGFLDQAGEPGALVAADYRPALLTMAGVLAVGFVANLMIRPVADTHFDDDAHAANEDRISDRLGATR